MLILLQFYFWENRKVSISMRKKYIDSPARNRFVEAWANSKPVGYQCRPSEAASEVRALLPAGARQKGYGGMSVAHVLITKCGWMRSMFGVAKPTAQMLVDLGPDEVI